MAPLLQDPPGLNRFSIQLFAKQSFGEELTGIKKAPQNQYMSSFAGFAVSLPGDLFPVVNQYIVVAVLFHGIKPGLYSLQHLFIFCS